MTQPTLLELADQYAKEYFMGRGEDARKRLQAAIIHSEVAADKAVTDAREVCAVVAWNHYMDVCVSRKYSPAEWGHWCAACAIRAISKP